MITILFPSGNSFTATVDQAKRVVKGDRRVRGITPHLGGAQWYASYEGSHDHVTWGYSVVATDRATLERVVEHGEGA